MKKSIVYITFLFIFLSESKVFSQEVIRQKSCTDKMIMETADSIKLDLINQGFIVIKEASITMESEYEMPVIFPLTEGSLYQIVFIGDKSSKLFELRMYDWNENQLMNEKNKSGDKNAHIIGYSFIPPKKQFYIIKPLQVNKKKKKDLCGYVMLLRKFKK